MQAAQLRPGQSLGAMVELRKWPATTLLCRQPGGADSARVTVACHIAH